MGQNLIGSDRSIKMRGVCLEKMGLGTGKRGTVGIHERTGASKSPSFLANREGCPQARALSSLCCKVDQDLHPELGHLLRAL